MNADENINKIIYYESLSIVIKLSFLFLIGIGNYRSILLLIIYFSIKSISKKIIERVILNLLFVPVFLYLIFYDLEFGQLWLERSNNFILFVVLFIVVDHVLTRYINIFFEKTSNGHVFTYCSNCRYENKQLTIKCNNCNYEKIGDGEINYDTKQSKYDISFFGMPKLLRHELGENNILNLSLSSEEFIHISIKVIIGNSPYINGFKRLCSFIVFTNKNIIFMHKIYIHRGYRWKENVNLLDVKEVSKENKKISISSRQAIRITNGQQTFDIFLWSLNKTDSSFEEHFNIIKNHIQKMQCQN